MVLETEKSQEKQDCFVIDFLPQIMESPVYFKLEKFFLQTYLKEFSQKVIRIVFKLMGYYSVQLYLTEFPEESKDSLRFKYPVEKDLSNRPLEEIAQIIDHVIVNDISSVQITLGTKDKSYLSIEGEFSVAVYSLSKDFIELLTALTVQEGLFLRKSTES